MKLDQSLSSLKIQQKKIQKIQKIQKR